SVLLREKDPCATSRQRDFSHATGAAGAAGSGASDLTATASPQRRGGHGGRRGRQRRPDWEGPTAGCGILCALCVLCASVVMPLASGVGRMPSVPGVRAGAGVGLGAGVGPRDTPALCEPVGEREELLVGALAHLVLLGVLEASEELVLGLARQ